MAINKEITVREMDQSNVPSGYVATSFTDLVGERSSRVDEYVVPVGALDDADALVGFGNIVTQVDSYMTTYADTILHLDAADTIELRCFIKYIKRPPATPGKVEQGTGVYQNTGADEYVIGFRVEHQ